MLVERVILSLFFSISFLSCESPQLNFQEGKTSVSFSGFEKIQAEILVPKCIRCHKEETEKNHMVDLTSYKSIMESSSFLKVVKPGSPDKSTLYTSIMKDPSDVGAMSKDSARLSVNETKLIKEWILSGAGQKPNDGDPNDGDPNDCDPNDPNDCEPDGEPNDDEPDDDDNDLGHDHDHDHDEPED